MTSLSLQKEKRNSHQRREEEEEEEERNLKPPLSLALAPSLFACTGTFSTALSSSSLSLSLPLFFLSLAPFYIPYIYAYLCERLFDRRQETGDFRALHTWRWRRNFLPTYYVCFYTHTSSSSFTFCLLLLQNIPHPHTF